MVVGFDCNKLIPKRSPQSELLSLFENSVLLRLVINVTLNYTHFENMLWSENLTQNDKCFSINMKKSILSFYLSIIFFYRITHFNKNMFTDTSCVQGVWRQGLYMQWLLCAIGTLTYAIRLLSSGESVKLVNVDTHIPSHILLSTCTLICTETLQ